MGTIFGKKTVQLVTHDNHGRPKHVDDYLIKDIMDMVEAKAQALSPPRFIIGDGDDGNWQMLSA